MVDNSGAVPSPRGDGEMFDLLVLDPRTRMAVVVLANIAVSVADLAYGLNTELARYADPGWRRPDDPPDDGIGWPDVDHCWLRDGYGVPLPVDARLADVARIRGYRVVVIDPDLPHSPIHHDFVAAADGQARILSELTPSGADKWFHLAGVREMAG